VFSRHAAHAIVVRAMLHLRLMTSRRSTAQLGSTFSVKHVTAIGAETVRGMTDHGETNRAHG
jgi:hypothetical protein